MNLTYREQKILLRDTAAWHRAERRRKMAWIAFFAVMLTLIVIAGPECGHGGC
jgi:hypothetical protein